MNYFNMIFIILYLLIMNILGFSLMGMDKAKAIRGAWRISEATLFTVALIGGSLGATLGMRLFRHKTRHWYFRYGFPSILLIHVLLLSLCLPYLFASS